MFTFNSQFLLATNLTLEMGHPAWCSFILVSISGLFQDPPGTNLGVGARAKVNQQLLERKKAAFIYHFIVNEPDEWFSPLSPLTGDLVSWKAFE